MPNEIPTVRREQVTKRSNGRCERCGVRGHDKHHRRRRREFDAHQHCACNLINLCRTCHGWVHNHPFEAMQHGFKVRYSISDPASVPVRFWNGEHIMLDHDGTFEFVLDV